MDKRFVGSWKLTRSEMWAGDEVFFPLGKDCQGFLSINDNGTLSGQLMNPARPMFLSDDILGGTDNEIRAAYQGYVAYWGEVAVDAEAGTIRTRVLGSLYPNWIGQSQERFFTFEGSQLILKTPPILAKGVSVVGVLVWERM